MKPRLIICPGIAKSGTTTLWRVLEDNGVIGHVSNKETHYLSILYGKDYDEIYPTDIKVKFGTWLIQKNGFETYSLDNYVHYLKSITSPVDFSQTISNLPEHFLKEIRDVLLEHFRVKIIILYRDPVERLFSQCTNLSIETNRWGCETKSPIEFFYDCINKPAFQTLYNTVSSKFDRVFDDVLSLSMKKFYGSQKEHDRLAEFLEVPSINMLNRKDNATSYHSHKLSEKDIEIGKEKLKPSYEYYSTLIS